MVDKKLSIEKIDIHSLVPADYNPRKISDKDYDNLKKSIDEFGIVDPIIVNLKDNTIIGGHQRFDVLFYDKNIDELNLLRLGDIGWVFPDTNLEIKDKNHEKTLNLALNRIHGEWDEDLVSEVLMELEELNLDHLTGFDLELDDINYDFLTREDEYLQDEEEYDDNDDEEVIFEETIYYNDDNDDEDEDESSIIIEEYDDNPKEEVDLSKDRIRRGFVKYGEVYKIGDSSYLMFGKEANEQDRSKLFNCNIQKKLPNIPQDFKIKTIKQDIDYYMCNDAEIVEDIILKNKKICKKIL